MNKKIKKIFKKNLNEILLILFASSFSWWLMFSTFSYENGSMLISSKAWSDFASHIPLIRSFSFGDNFPPQYPLFAGPPIRYHFLFYLLVGMLERVSLRIDYALDIPSALGFTGLLVMIYLFAKLLFKSTAVSILSVILFLFNGSLSFLYFFKQHPLSINIFDEIITNRRFPSFGPYDSGIVSAFWNLNIYTNQRHLGLSYALSFLLIYYLIRHIDGKREIKPWVLIAIGLAFGISFILNSAVFLMTIIVLVFLFLLFPKLRIFIFTILTITALVSLPQYLYFQTGQSFGSKIIFFPGYLINDHLNFVNFISYWFMNLGLHLVLILLGFILAPKKIKKIFIAFFSIFIIGNLLKFSPEIAANHKFFNFFMILGVMFSAYSLTLLWKKNIFLKPVVIILFFFLIFSGIIDFFPIYNDGKIALADYKSNPNISWIIKNTKPNAVFLNTQFLYDPASLAGRKIFLGWPYFAWSQGYDTFQKGALMKQIFEETDSQKACRLLKENNIDFVEINIPSLTDPNLPKVSKLYLEGFKLIYNSRTNDYFIIDVKNSCKE